MITRSRVTFLCAFIFFINSKASISESVSFGSISVKQAGSSVVFEGAGVRGEPGSPELPFVCYTYLLPPDADLDNVTASLEGVTEEILPGIFDVKPALPPTANGEIIYPAGLRIVNGKNSAVYNTNAFFPQTCIGEVITGKLDEYKLVDVYVHPFRYNPVTKQLKKITGGTLVVTTQKARTVSSFPYGVAERYSQKVQQLVRNYSKAASLYPTPKREATGPKYVILTTASIKSGAKNLGLFVQMKQARGFDVQIVDESTWGGGTGGTAADNVRKWLKANYQSLAISYLLVIGDPTPASGAIAMKEYYPNSDGGSGTDYYFSELSGTGDKNANGKCGESSDRTGGDPDLFHELKVGRIPVYNNDIASLDKILMKMVSYEMEDVNTAKWRFKCLLPMEPSDGNTPGNHLGEFIKDKVLVPNTWAYYRIYDSSTPGNPEKTPCDMTNVLNAWLADSYGICCWWTHGSSTSASGIMNTTNAAKLKDDRPTFTYQVSCTNASPKTATNLAYSLLKNGAIGTIAGTNLTYYSPGQTNYDNSGSNAATSYAWAGLVVKDKLPAGDALNKLRETIKDVWWVNWVVFVIYGDPSLGPYICGTSTSPFIAVSTPNGGEQWEQGTAKKILFNDNIDGNVKIELLKGGAVKEVLAATTPSSGSFDWNIPAGYEPGTDYKIKITSIDSAALLDQSDQNFSIIPEVYVVCPYKQTFDTLDTGKTILPKQWEQGGADDFDWLVLKNKTPTKISDGATGPDADHTGSGNYIYVESSTSPFNGNPTKKVDVTTPKFYFKNIVNPRLSFWYHMFSNNEGADEMGELHLDICVDGTWKSDVFTVSKNQGDKWIEKVVDLNSYKGERVIFRFRAITGSGWASDICIDDFVITGDGVGIHSTAKHPGSFNLHYAASSIRFRIPESAGKNSVVLTLHNAQGKQVRSLVNSTLPAGSYAAPLKNIAAGLYLATIEAQGLKRTIPVFITQ